MTHTKTHIHYNTAAYTHTHIYLKAIVHICLTNALKALLFSGHTPTEDLLCRSDPYVGRFILTLLQ